MTGNFKRTKNSTDVVGSKSQDLAYNDRAGAYKMLGPILGKLSVLGALDTAKGVEKGSLVAVYNNSGAAVFVNSGAAAMAAPSSTTGIAVPPNAYIIIAVGDDNYVRASSAAALGYLILDESSYNPQP